MIGHQLLDSAVYPVDTLPSVLLLSDIIWVCLASFVLTVVATLMPAWLVSKHDPATVLKYE
jgi:lipoprotein-releasing system permease protein